MDQAEHLVAGFQRDAHEGAERRGFELRYPAADDEPARPCPQEPANFDFAHLVYLVFPASSLCACLCDICPGDTPRCWSSMTIIWVTCSRSCRLTRAVSCARCSR